ncbi:SagB family peptide dehydrogenase [Ahrensia marina]|uniref:SagB family peptide dehydrogenase n=1 Tax=Ahrensia marina TaxID=1514904 RepID=UPI0035CE8FB6
MHYRASHALVFYAEGETGLVGLNYLQNKRFAGKSDIITLLGVMGDWSTPGAIAEALGINDEQLLSVQLNNLADSGIVVREGSDEAELEDAHFSAWKWGAPAALYHHIVQDRPVMSVDEALDKQREKIDTTDQPDAYFVPGAADKKIELPREWCFADYDLGQSMDGRRSVREVTAAPISMEALSDCLRAGFGINGYTQNDAGVRLPLSFTPSGGARNPYDAFVFAETVEGLVPGIYRYAPLSHALVPCGQKSAGFSAMLGGQDWPDRMSCFIVLRADFSRSMWKYDDANAYRVALIEAGHIGQNVMLAATAHSLTACPSAALNHAQLAEDLGHTDDPVKAAVYALGLGHPDQSLAGKENDPKAGQPYSMT